MPNPEPGPDHMTPAEFANHLDRYGAQLPEWPVDMADAARLLLAKSEEARDAHRRAVRLDGVLALGGGETASDALRQRLIDAAQMIAAGEDTGWRELAHSLWPFGPLWRPAAGLAAAAVVGVVIGLANPVQQAVSVDAGQALAEEILVLASADGSLQEIAE